MRVSCWGGFYLGIYLLICLFIFFFGGGNWGPACVVLAYISGYVFLVFLLWYCVFLSCHQFCFNLEIWCFVVFSRVAGYVCAWLHCFHGSSHLSFTFFCGAGVLPHYFNYPRTDLNLTSILFVYHVILLVVVIL